MESRLVGKRLENTLKRYRVSPFLKDFLTTGATAVTTGLALLIVTSILARGLGPDGFGAYALSKRIMATVAPLSTFAMGITITRHVAMTEDICSRFRILLIGFLLGVLPSVVIALLGTSFALPLSTVIYYRTGYTSVFAVTLFMLVGYSLYTVLCAFYRGSGQMGRANFWQLVVVAVGPLVIAATYARPDSLTWILFLMGVLYFTTGVPLGFFLLKGILALRRGAFAIRGPLKEIIWYALPRVPAGLLLEGIMSVGPFLASYLGSVRDAGYLVVGQYLFLLPGAGTSSFALVLLPKATQLLLKDHREFLKQRIVDITILAIHLGLYLSIHLFLWSDILMYIWLGHDYQDVIPVIRIIAVGLVPYLLYDLLRSVIDGVENRAINTYNLFLALGMTVASSIVFGFMGMGVRGLAVGTIIGIVTLGLATVWYLWRTGWMSPEVIRLSRLKECLWLNASALAIVLMFRSIMGPSMATVRAVVGALILEALVFSFYFAMLRHYHVRWISELERRVPRAGVP